MFKTATQRIEQRNRQMETAKILATTTKVSERIKRERKALIDIQTFIVLVFQWQRERPPLFETDMNLDLLKVLSVGEIYEIEEHRQNEGLPGYSAKSETGEAIDYAFFLAAMAAYLNMLGKYIDLEAAVAKANGQMNTSRSIDYLREVTGNISEKTLEKDLQHMWTNWTSYLLHMPFPVNPTEVLREYTFPKNNGNYNKKYLANNPLFERAYGRTMNRDEKLEYFSHYRKAARIIRDFIIKYVDANVEHSGLKNEHLDPYLVFIFSFISIPGIGISGSTALEMLENQLYADFNVLKPKKSELHSNRLVFAN